MWFNLIVKLIIISRLFGVNKESIVFVSGYNGFECEMELSIWLWVVIILCNEWSCVNIYYIILYCFVILIKARGFFFYIEKFFLVIFIVCEVKNLYYIEFRKLCI